MSRIEVSRPMLPASGGARNLFEGLRHLLIAAAISQPPGSDRTILAEGWRPGSPRLCGFIGEQGPALRLRRRPVLDPQFDRPVAFKSVPGIAGPAAGREGEGDAAVALDFEYQARRPRGEAVGVDVALLGVE